MGTLYFYEKPCPCGEGKVKWESWERYSSYGGVEHTPREILCPSCKERYEIKTISGWDRKTGEQYSYVDIREK